MYDRVAFTQGDINPARGVTLYRDKQYEAGFQASESHTQKPGMELESDSKRRAKPKAKTTAKAKPKANPAASEDYNENHYETIENQ